MKRIKGRELPATFNSMIVSNLFLEQSTPCEAIAQSHVDRVWKAAKEASSSADVSDSTKAGPAVVRVSSFGFLSLYLKRLHLYTNGLVRANSRIIG